MLKVLHITISLLLISSLISGQDTAQEITISIANKKIQLKHLIVAIEKQTALFVSYNTQKIDLEEAISFNSLIIDIGEIERQLEAQLNLEVEHDRESNKLLLVEKFNLHISGVVKDKDTGETLQEVTIYSRNNISTYTNQDGYFHLQLNNPNDSIYFNYLGYKTEILSISKLDGTRLDILLNADNTITLVVINQDSTEYPTNPMSPRDVNLDENNPAFSIGGRNDLINSIKQISGVSVGSEAQNGFTIRGGGPDQNLVLLDGLPVYGTSHLGGLSSIFVDNVIKKADLYKSGIPARYGGKLSSVLDIRMKDGNRLKVKRSLAINLENTNAFIEGPISKNTSIIINGRTSHLNLFTDKIIPEASGYVNTDLKYDDVYTKLSHWFSPSNRVSFSMYYGNDKVLLEREKTELDISFEDYNKRNWNNTLVALHWNAALTDKLFLHSHAGLSNFTFDARSASFVSKRDSTGVTIRETSSLDITTISQQKDKLAKLYFDYFFNNDIKLKLGIGGILHESKPSILELETYLDPIETNSDSTYLSQEYFAFLEQNIKLTPVITLNAGLRLNVFNSLDTSYNYFQPRLNLQYNKRQHQLSLGYSRMSQFLHLLVDQSSGFPSDLLVPSTSTIAPEISKLISLEYKFSSKKKWDFGISTFYNRYENLISYKNPYELIQAIVTDHFPFNWDTETRNWEERVTTGTGRSFGLEFDFNYTTKKFSLGLAYTLSRSERTFNFGEFSENKLQTFLYKYDRPHNIATGFQYFLSENSSFNINWVFGNGNLWTFTEHAEPGLDGLPIFSPKERNNRRLSDYHRLGLAYKIKKQLKNSNFLEFTLGLYNAYNNKNPFYLYIEENPNDTGPAVLLKEISLYPIFPQINLQYSW